MKAIGITCGIGSMLIGARDAGFDIVGNIEWRKYYHEEDGKGRNTFRDNFPGAFLVHSIDEVDPKLLKGIDLAMGHPECGNFSQLSSANANRLEKLKDAADIPLFCQLIARIKPRFFAMDDLPRSLEEAFPIEEYKKILPEYDLFPEWINNYGYGNIQKNRKRMFMIGARKTERFVFRPGEHSHYETISSMLKSLTRNVPNHDPHELDVNCGKAHHMLKRDGRYTWREVRDWFAKQAEGTGLPYVMESGRICRRPGTYKSYWNGHSYVLDGGSPTIHPRTNLPFSLRDRLRIQGADDDFVLYGTKLNKKGQWNHEKNMALIKQTGKFMPIQFCKYIAHQFMAHLKGKVFKATELRLVPSNPDIDHAKLAYCKQYGYGKQQKQACGQCWLKCSKPGVPLIEEHAPVERAGKKRGPKGPRIPRATQPAMKGKVPELIYTSPVTTGEKDMELEPVYCSKDKCPPKDYHASKAKYAKNYLGNLIRRDGTHYSRHERKQWLKSSDHIALTPPHIARWLIQEFTRPGDTVFDPFVGGGTTGVEAIRQGRNFVGIELEFAQTAKTNIEGNDTRGTKVRLYEGDSQHLATCKALKKGVQLVVTNPPYFGDQRVNRTYEATANLGKLQYGQSYFKALTEIFAACHKVVQPGGFLAIGVKDTMKCKQYFLLHEMIGDCIVEAGFNYYGLATMKHFPLTQYLNTYPVRHGIQPPIYQSIVVFKKSR
jgi:site-specific DNA-cytosine methylase/DNA modification methylase